MKRIYFKNQKNRKNVMARTLRRGREMQAFELKECEEGLFFDFDNEKYKWFIIESESVETTGMVFPGNLSLGVDYQFNDKLGRDLTYLWSRDIKKTGRVENHIIRDEKNLYYREDKSKKISVFLPESYDGVTPHDILYFFDAQNLFCMAGEYTDKGDPYGSWQLDLVLSEIYRQYGKSIIVVGIDNADSYRSRELFMNPKRFGEHSDFAKTPDGEFSNGYLESLSSFMVTTLHSFIKENYCVKEDNIGLGGSSMGGIASFFCGLYKMGFYKYILSYSPAFALFKSEAFERWFKLIDFKKHPDLLPKIHIYCGGGDELEKNLLYQAVKMKETLVSYGYDEEKVFESYDLDKPHNEESWRLVLPESFTNLLGLQEIENG